MEKWMLAAYNETWVCPGLAHCIFVSGTAVIGQIAGIRKEYRQVLIHQPILCGKCLIGNGFVFQHVEALLM